MFRWKRLTTNLNGTQVKFLSFNSIKEFISDTPQSDNWLCLLHAVFKGHYSNWLLQWLTNQLIKKTLPETLFRILSFSIFLSRNYFSLSKKVNDHVLAKINGHFVWILEYFFSFKQFLFYELRKMWWLWKNTRIENLLKKWNKKRGKKKNLWFGQVFGSSGIFDGLKFDFKLQWNLFNG